MIATQTTECPLCGSLVVDVAECIENDRKDMVEANALVNAMATFTQD